MLSAATGPSALSVGMFITTLAAALSTVIAAFYARRGESHTSEAALETVKVEARDAATRASEAAVKSLEAALEHNQGEIDRLNEQRTEDRAIRQRLNTRIDELERRIDDLGIEAQRERTRCEMEKAELRRANDDLTRQLLEAGQ